jgi:acetolactate synthase-1/2/3 large subunit
MDAVVPLPRQESGRAADRLVRWLESRQLDRVFGIPGGAAAPVFDALVDAQVEVVVCQHEGMAGYLAYGHARATGRPGVILVTSGPGVLNTITAVAAAYQDEVPLIVLAGEVRTDWSGKGALQDGGTSGLDLATMFRPVVRFQDSLTQPERVEALLDQAWEAAMTHPRGPVLLRLPVDVAAKPVPSVPEWRTTPRVEVVEREPIERAAVLLGGATRPAIFAGIGARTAEVGDEIRRLAYRLRCPVISDIEAKGVLSERDQLSLGLFGVGASPSAMRYLKDGIDVLLTVGARLDDTTTSGFSPLLRPTKAHIQLDHDPRRLHRAWRADVAVAADLRESLDLLIAALPRQTSPQLLGRDAAVWSAKAGPVEVIPPLGEAPFDPRAVVVALQNAVGPETVFTSDIGNHLLFAGRHLVTEHAGGFHVSIGLGGMGSGIGAAMGLASAYRGSRTVVGICGDGGLLMVGNELATCARYDIPLVLAVLDNSSLAMVDHGMQRHYGRSNFAGVAHVDLCAYVSSLGVPIIDATSEDDFHEAVERSGRRPLVIYAAVDPDVRAANPREHGFQVGTAHA